MPPNPSVVPTRRAQVATLAGLAIFACGILFASHSHLGVAIRTIGIAVLAYAAAQWRSITAWTFFAIIAGIALGVDLPAVALHTHVLAEIFLRLVRVIVAPLIFATLTTGIAAHGQVRSLGRLALKMLIDFEVVTTLGLLLGATAINISRAGEGIALAGAGSTANQTTATITQPGFESFLLNMFPENIALAVSQNQILQVAVFSI